jgi:hypothetical protein
MPRIYEGDTNDPLDFCKRCFPKESAAAAIYKGSDEFYGYDSEHPPYSDTDYTCQKCNRKLSDKDN